MATFYGDWVGTDDFRTILTATVTNVNDNVCNVRLVVQCQSIYAYANASGYASCYCNGSDTGAINHAIVQGQTTTMIDKTFQVSRTGSSWQCTVSARTWIDSNLGGYREGSIASGTVTIPARPYYAHGTPTISASKSTANYGESVTISWGKSATQGNANFDRFELWQGSNKLYSGSGVSKSVKPSDVTGAKGGTATYTIKEIHEWYGSYPSTQNSTTITVRSGVVSAYDSSGAKHTGLVTAYDSSGNAHYVLITAYDSEGKAHSVV